ncbi:ABC transporter substrate-binding protein [Nocardioides sp. Soil796]|uniref:ABC transporter substrate-binding protein n=1 Tax=Nocardioides sp. Soil796 TaxID=1736412 RepID=UPI00070929B7|nr:ABC transporter substrate-binding protein [Nocardioides sp. Soil796]KRF10392.1 hypothetical protein ASH02_19970 [Nocardioides sp. Soil796]
MKQKLIAACAAVLTVATLSACSGSGGEDTVRIGYIAGATASIPDIIAEEKGFFADHDVEVKMVNTNNGPSLVTLLLSGGVDVTWAPTSVALAATDKVSVAAGNVRNYGFEFLQRKGYDDESAAKGYPENVASLKGAKIGVSATGSYAQEIATHILKEAGVDEDDVTFIGVGVEGTALGALKSKQIDVLMAGTITSAKGETEGIGTTLVSTLDVPELAGLPESIYAVKRDADDKTLDKAGRYLAAIKDAMDWAHDPANADELGDILVKSFKLEGDAADLVRKEWPATGDDLIGEYRLDFDEKGYDTLVDILVDGGLLKKPVSYDDAVNLIAAK